MFLTETILCYSIENFLVETEVETILSSIEGWKRNAEPDAFVAGVHGHSVHSIPGFDVKQAVSIYEPQGRIEIPELPHEICNIMDEAFSRHSADIRRAYPSITSPDCWIYLEYGPGQYITYLLMTWGTYLGSSSLQVTQVFL